MGRRVRPGASDGGEQRRPQRRRRRRRLHQVAEELAVEGGAAGVARGLAPIEAAAADPHDEPRADGAAGDEICHGPRQISPDLPRRRMSGVVHFTFDRFFTTRTPVLGKTFVSAFRQHHADPVDITRHGFIATNGTNGNNSLATLPILLGVVAIPLDLDHAWHLFAATTVLWAGIATFGTNQFHKWAHQPEVPPGADPRLPRLPGAGPDPRLQCKPLKERRKRDIVA